MISRIRKLFRLPRHRKRLLVEISYELLRAAWIVKHSHFQTYVASLGQPMPGDASDDTLPEPPLEHLRDVAWALKRINKLAGGRFTCLMLAMAGKRALNRRHVPNSLVLAARPDRGSGDDPFGAHSWLRSGQYVVIGAEESVGHIPLVSYLSGHPN